MRPTVHIPEDLARLHRQAAENEGKSMSALTAEALEAYLKERGFTGPPPPGPPRGSAPPPPTGRWAPPLSPGRRA